MSGVGEELAAFDQEVCNSFLGLSVDDVNAVRDPPDQQGRTRLREALAFITEQQLHAWVADQNERQGIAPTVGDTLKTTRRACSRAQRGDGSAALVERRRFRPVQMEQEFQAPVAAGLAEATRSRGRPAGDR